MKTGGENMARQEKERANKKTRNYGFYDYSLLFLILFLVCFGLIMIFSTSYYTAQIYKQDSMYYLKRQGILAVAGIFVMLAISKIDYRIWLKKVPFIRIKWVILFYLVSIALLVYVLLFGLEINGATRWIDLGPLGTFQPSDLAKFSTILFTAYIIYLTPRITDKLTGYLKVTLFIAPLILLIGKENMSTAIVICGIFTGICFVASRKKLYFLAAGAGMTLIGAAYIFLGNGFRSNRIDIWLHIEEHEDAFQILQGLYAIASGGLFGKGLGQSMQKLGYVPEAQNDMIFSIICEELGLFGATAIVILFILLIWRIFVIAISAPDLFGGLLCAGVLIQVALQVVINIAVVTNSIPSTGVPLPFISYGGTSVAVLLMEMGFVLSVSNQITKER